MRPDLFLWLLCGALLLASTPAWAQDARAVRAERIARALGIEQFLIETQAASLAAAKGQVSELVSGLKKATRNCRGRALC
jgi:hypothetical protein